MPLFVIRVYRPEREEIDPVHIRADDRDDAESFVQQMYPTGTIVKRRKRKTA